ncbi:MAG TPA: DUF3299 domain-containing protein [bacterium]|nr:DUF3299 domain-containing protein [bacterium]
MTHPNRIKTYVKIAGAGRKARITYESRIPPTDWKFWAMIALSVAWFVLLAFMLSKAASTPSLGQWWKTMSAREETPGKNAAPGPKPPVPAGKIPWPQEGDHYRVGFEALASFPCEITDVSQGTSLSQDDTNRGDPFEKKPASKKKRTYDIPAPIRTLNGQKVEVVGFMIPMATDKEKVSSFILAQSRMTCCYGVTPKLNQWIYVKMVPGSEIEGIMDVPVTVHGTLDIGREFDEENGGWCLYRMSSDRVKVPRRSWF